MNRICQELRRWLQEGRIEHIHQLPPHLEGHLLLCATCQKERAQHKQLSSWIAEVAAPPHPPPHPEHLVTRTLALAQRRQQERIRRKPWLLLPVASCAALLIACLTWWPSSPSPTQAIGSMAPSSPPSPRRAARPSHVQMIWPADHVFVVSKPQSTPKKRPSKSES